MRNALRKLLFVMSWLFFAAAVASIGVAITYFGGVGEGRGGPAGVLVLFVLGFYVLIIGGGAFLLGSLMRFFARRLREKEESVLQENKSGV